MRALTGRRRAPNHCGTARSYPSPYASDLPTGYHSQGGFESGCNDGRVPACNCFCVGASGNRDRRQALRWSHATVRFRPAPGAYLSSNERRHPPASSASDHSSRISFCMAIATQCFSLVHLLIDTISWYHVEEMNRFSLPSLKSLHILVDPDDDETNLLAVVSLFDIPAATDLIIDHAHGDCICVLFNATTYPDLSFPAVSSLSFFSRDCSCETSHFVAQPIPALPLRLFPALSSLTFIEGCFTAHIVEEILGPAAQPWPLLKTLTMCPQRWA
ncbi:hypothetical protein B0H17DRAFT_1039224 [Mycena rosella]|uniref:Uncharacterized protein n=1 Tax=Mycena rosella TaxID=1033263 RepID=A0AAD7GSI2_MYCRO|nr:hypothetical protein B0H17DRAFT_1039224 [Mycena rosella]